MTEPSGTFESAVAEADEVLNALLSKITDVDNHNPYLRVMIYGDPGVGKTVFTATAPSPLIIDIEDGAKSIKNHPALKDKVKALKFKSIPQVEALIQYLKDDHPAFSEYETVTVDSFSDLQKRDLDNIVREAAKTDASRDRYLPTGPDYNINTEHLRQFATDLRAIKKHIIITCHVKEEKDGVTGRILVRPNLTPKLAGTLAGMFDLVGYMSLTGSGENTVRTLQVHPTPSVTAKTRLGSLPAVMENPTFDDLLTAFNEQ